LWRKTLTFVTTGKHYYEQQRLPFAKEPLLLLS